METLKLKTNFGTFLLDVKYTLDKVCVLCMTSARNRNKLNYILL